MLLYAGSHGVKSEFSQVRNFASQKFRLTAGSNFHSKIRFRIVLRLRQKS